MPFFNKAFSLTFIILLIASLLLGITSVLAAGGADDAIGNPSLIEIENGNAYSNETPPEARADKTSPEIRTDETSPEIWTDETSPEIWADESSPDTRADEAPPETRADETSPDAQTDETSPDTRADDTPPQAQTDDTPPQARTDETPPQARADETLPQAQTDDTPPQALADETSSIPGGSLQATLAEAGDSSNLRDFTTAPVVITDLSGRPVSGEFLLGENYLFSINFAEDPAGLQFAYENGYLKYQLPPELLITQALTNQPIYGNPRSAVIGHYNIPTDGAIAVWFDDCLEDGTPTLGKNFIDNYINAHFTMVLAAQFDKLYESQEIDFGNDVSVEVSVKPRQTTLRVEKSATEYDIPTETIKYTVKIWPESGAAKNITLKDAMLGNAENIPTDQNLSLTSVMAADILKNMSVSVNGQTPITISPTPRQGFSLDFDALLNDTVILGAGEEIVVTYELDARELIKKWGARKLSSTGGQYADVDYNYALRVSNTATAEGQDENGSPLKGDGSVTRLLRRTFMAKTGTQNPTNDRYTWTATIGDGATKMAGMIISDTLNLGQTLATNTYSVSGSPYAVRATLYGADGRAIPGNDYIAAASGASSFTYTVPALWQGQEVYSVRFEYVSILPANPASETPFANTVTIPNRDGIPTFTYTKNFAVIGSSKTYTFVLDQEGNLDYIEWVVETYIPGSMFGQPLYFTDYLRFNLPNGSLIGAEHIPFNMECFFRPLGAPQADNEEYLGPYTLMMAPGVALSDAQHQYTRGNEPDRGKQFWYFCFMNIPPAGTSNNNAKSMSLSPFEDDTTFTLVYRTPASTRLLTNTTTLADENSYGGLLTVGEILLEYIFSKNASTGITNISTNACGRLTNHWAPFTCDPDGSNERRLTNEIGATAYWPIYKHAEKAGADTIKYTVVINNSKLPGLFDGGIVPVLFSDVFDSRLEYVESSFNIYRKYNDTPTNANNAYVGPYTNTGLDLTKNYITDNGNGACTLAIDFTDPAIIRYDWNSTAQTRSNFRAPPANWHTLSTAAYEITYTLRVKPEYADKFAPENTVGINIPFFDNQNFGYTKKMEIGEPVVEKEMNESGNIAAVSIIINPSGKKLAGDAGLYTVNDKMDEGLAFFISSIRAYTQGGAVGNWNGVWNTQAELWSPTPGAIWSYDLLSNTEIAFTFPDETPVKLEYNALILGNVGDTVAIGNKVTVAGKYEGEAGNANYTIGSVGSGGGSTGSVTLVKTDESSGGPLAGGAFALYAGYTYPGYEERIPQGGAEARITVGAQIFYYMEYDVTDAQGQIYWLNNQYILPGFVFALVELSPPANYKLPTDPVLFTYISPPTPAQTAAVGGRPIAQIAEVLGVTNAKLGFVFPETGGIGRAPFTVAAGILSAVLIIYFGRRRGCYKN